jgi:hypothetical protein
VGLIVTHAGAALAAPAWVTKESQISEYKHYYILRASAVRQTAREFIMTSSKVRFRSLTEAH